MTKWLLWGGRGQDIEREKVGHPPFKYGTKLMMTKLSIT